MKNWTGTWTWKEDVDSRYNLNEPTRTFVRLDMKHERKTGIRMTPNFWCEQLSGV